MGMSGLEPQTAGVSWGREEVRESWSICLILWVTHWAISKGGWRFVGFDGGDLGIDVAWG